jgi:DNA primase
LDSERCCFLKACFLLGVFITLRRRGMGFVGTCPHCHEKAMYIDPKHQIYKCFGCGKTGNVINYVMAERKLEDADALNYLESKYCNN